MALRDQDKMRPNALRSNTFLCILDKKKSLHDSKKLDTYEMAKYQDVDFLPVFYETPLSLYGEGRTS